MDVPTHVCVIYARTRKDISESFLSPTSGENRHWECVKSHFLKWVVRIDTVNLSNTASICIFLIGI